MWNAICKDQIRNSRKMQTYSMLDARMQKAICKTFYLHHSICKQQICKRAKCKTATCKTAICEMQHAKKQHAKAVCKIVRRVNRLV